MSRPGNRATQLDGWRAIAVLGVMWLHWTPASWRGIVPFEIGLFFFLTLTGFLITRILLEVRERGEAAGGPWRKRAVAEFLRKRFARILAPAYAAMLLALLVGARDIRAHVAAYALHVSNFHMAWLPEWPHGTAHYWSLAIQMQFYVLWPFVVLFAPGRWLAWVFAVCAALAPALRFALGAWFPEIRHVEAITPVAFDYFGAGALLALAMRCGVSGDDPRVRWIAWICGAGYVALYLHQEMVAKLPVAGCFQQTFLAFAMAGLIAASWKGFAGVLGKTLDHPVLQHIGKVSYGLYLFHTIVPLLLGWIVPQLWYAPWFDLLLPVRLVVFALVSWGLAWLCWRWLEGPERLRFLGV